MYLVADINVEICASKSCKLCTQYCPEANTILYSEEMGKDQGIQVWLCLCGGGPVQGLCAMRVGLRQHGQEQCDQDDHDRSAAEGGADRQHHLRGKEHDGCVGESRRRVSKGI